jgi:uncharacterized membrane protein
MKNSTVEVVIGALQSAVKESDRMLADIETHPARTVGFLQGTINATISFLKEQLADEEALAMIERLEDEDFVKRDLGL